jgi:hypothetical protein
MAINFKIDGRDPTGYYWTAKRDSIKIDSMSIAGRSGITDAYAAADPSFIYDYDYQRADSSRLNLGADGDNPMGLRLKYQGINYRLTMIHKRGTLGGVYGAANYTVSTDLGLFSLQDVTNIDSVTSVKAYAYKSGADTAGSVFDLVVEFTVPAENRNRGQPVLHQDQGLCRPDQERYYLRLEG